jgi:hypothetical protein
VTRLRLIVALALAQTVAGTAFAQQQPPAAAQAACRGDAQRLCASQIGNPPAVRACLVQNLNQLSAECRRFVEQAR